MDFSEFDDLLLFIVTCALIFLMVRYIPPKKSVSRRGAPSTSIVNGKATSHKFSSVKSKADEQREQHLIDIKAEQNRNWPYYVHLSVKEYNYEINVKGNQGFDWQEFSPLKYYGYTVGKTKGLEVEQRHLVLIITFYADLPGIFPEEYRQRWGGAGTFGRYNKIANHVFMLYERNISRSQMECAVDDWKKDYDWFIRQYQNLANARRDCGL
jgi:hypothetical protein